MSAVRQRITRKKLNLSVKRQLQIWLLVRIMGIILLCSLAAALILFFYARQELNGSLWQAHIKIRRVSDLLLPVLLAGSGVSILAGLALAVFLPQKIAGPVYRIEQDLALVRAGNLKKEIRLRDKDILTDLADAINSTTAMFRSHTDELKRLSRRIAERTEQQDQEECLKILSEIAQRLETLET